MKPEKSVNAEFDKIATSYDGGMNWFKRLLGSGPEDFIRVKTDWIVGDFNKLGLWKPTAKLLDFGCGTGMFISELANLNFPGVLYGCDVSEQMLMEASRRWTQRTPANFFSLNSATNESHQGEFDAIIVSSVLHHIDPRERKETYERLATWLRPGGYIYVFEHNPLNPVTTWVVKNSPIDEGAILLASRETISGLTSAGTKTPQTDYLMFFPPRFKLGWLERHLSWLPLGGQYVVRVQC